MREKDGSRKEESRNKRIKEENKNRKLKCDNEGV